MLIQVLERTCDEHFLTDSDEVAIVDFVKDHKKRYDNTNKNFKDKARNDLQAAATYQ